MDAFIGLIFIVAIIYGACKLLSSDNQQSDKNTDQTDSSKSQDYHSSKSTSDTTAKLPKEEIDRIVNETKENQHYRVESTKTTGSSPQQPFDTTSDTKDTTKPSPRVISTPTAYYEIKKTSEDAKLKQNSPFSSGNTSVTTKSKTTSTYQTEYEKGHKEIEEGIKSGKYRVTHVPGNARTNKPSGQSKKPSNLQPSTKQSYSKPPTKPHSDEINPDRLDDYPLPQQRLLLTQYYNTHYFQPNSCGEIPLGEGLCHSVGVGSPDEAGVHTHRQIAHGLPSQAHISLMQTAFALVGAGGLDGQCGSLVAGHQPFAIEVVADGAVGDKAEGESQTASESQACVHEVQTAVLHVHAVAAALHASGREAHACIQYKAERVNGGI